MSFLQQWQQFLEKALLPGVLGIRGRVIEKRCNNELSAYFRSIASDIKKLRLEAMPMAKSKADKEMIRHIVEMRVSHTLRRHRAILREVLVTNMVAMYILGQKHEFIGEADDKKDKPQQGLDQLGASGQQAADWASSNVGELITGLDSRTVDIISDAVSTGIEDELGVGGTARLIRDAADGMSGFRARMIASTEMNRAFSVSALLKIGDLGFEYKRIILADDPCPICEDNAAQDPMPVDEDYESGDSAPPFHPNCRCAITAARAPTGEEGEDE